MSYTYNPYRYTKSYAYNDNIFQMDPTVPAPVPTEHEDSGKTLAQIYGMSFDEALAVVTEEKWAQVRKYRDAELQASDWTSGDDVPQSIKDVWAPYREALRNITDQEDPDNLVWPTKP